MNNLNNTELLNKSIELSKKIDSLNKILSQKIIRRDMLKKDIQTKLSEEGVKSFSDLTTKLENVSKQVQQLYDTSSKYLEDMSDKLSKLDKDVI